MRQKLQVTYNGVFLFACWLECEPQYSALIRCGFRQDLYVAIIALLHHLARLSVVEIELLAHVVFRRLVGYRQVEKLDRATHDVSDSVCRRSVDASFLHKQAHGLRDQCHLEPAWDCFSESKMQRRLVVVRRFVTVVTQVVGFPHPHELLHRCRFLVDDVSAVLVCAFVNVETSQKM